MGFLDTFKPKMAEFKAKGPAPVDPKVKVRKTALDNVEKQQKLLDNPGLKSEGGRAIGSWFLTDNEGDDVFAPKQTGQNLAERITKGKANSFPVIKDKKNTLLSFKEAIQAGEFDTVLLAISQETSARLAGRAPKGSGKKKGRR